MKIGPVDPKITGWEVGPLKEKWIQKKQQNI